MSEYSDRRSKEIDEDAKERCFQAKREADLYASHCTEIKTEKEIIEEAKLRYDSFFERDAFIREAEECFMLILYRKNTGEYKKP